MTNHRVKISPRVLTMLALRDDEELLFYKKISINPFYINGQKDARTLWVVTQQRIIFMDYFRLPILPENIRSWRKKDEIFVQGVSAVIAGKKTFTLAPQPLITIETAAKNKYEVVFYSDKSCRKSFNELKTIINDINPNMEFRDEIPPPDGISSLFSQKL